MADEAAPTGDSLGHRLLVVLTALGCVLAAYVFVGMPGLAGTVLGGIVPQVDPSLGWLPAAHFLVSAAMLGGGLWLATVLRGLLRPGLLPLLLFAIFQFGLLTTALENLAIGIGAIRMGGPEAFAGLGFVAVALAALRVHPDLYMAILRHPSWVRSFRVSELSPLSGSSLVALTVASNLVPLALFYQTLTMHSGAMFAALYRGAVIDPSAYWSGALAQIAYVSAIEAYLAAGAAGLSILLGTLWGLTRWTDIRRAIAADRVAQSLTSEQRRFIDDALPAVADAIMAKASARRFTIWTLVWMFIFTPTLLISAYAAAMWFDVWQERFALSWVTFKASDFTSFATGEPGYAAILIPAALVFIAATMNAPFARLFLRGAKFDFLAFSQSTQDVLRERLNLAVKSGAAGPGQPFDAGEFATVAARKWYWIRVPVALLAICAAAASGFWDIARGVAFTGDGLIVQAHFFSPPKLIRYHEVQAVAINCRTDALGARPVYELSLPDGRVVDMAAKHELDERLDFYLAVDRRLQFSGVGYAYPPGNLEPCLIAIQNQYNSVIAAGTARLLHVLD